VHLFGEGNTFALTNDSQTNTKKKREPNPITPKKEEEQTLPNAKKRNKRKEGQPTYTNTETKVLTPAIPYGLTDQAKKSKGGVKQTSGKKGKKGIVKGKARRFLNGRRERE